MSKINELRAQRAKTWEQTKAFLDSHRSDKGVLSAEDTTTYEKMEQEIVDLGREIERQERLDAFERELNTPVNTPITQKPDTAKVDTKTGRASDTYKKAFWAQTRTKGGMLTAEIRNALQGGVDSEGGYLVPDEFEQTLVQSLSAENVVRSLAHVITTASGSHKIPIVATKGTAAWVDEEGTIKNIFRNQGSLRSAFFHTQIQLSKEVKQHERILDDHSGGVRRNRRLARMVLGRM